MEHHSPQSNSHPHLHARVIPSTRTGRYPSEGSSIENITPGPITASRVPDELRAGFWSRHIGTAPQWYALEHHIQDTMTRMSPGYRPGYWHYRILSNGGIFILPDAAEDTQWPVCNTLFGRDARLSSPAAGMTVSLMTYALQAYQTGSDVLIGHYHRLRAFIVQHPEAQDILSLIDTGPTT
ncbi:antirestriction protein [Enterobacter asburiae]|uniref:antirestriction protein n=1 Tax=Enterobacter asburiae TaxID=61645 RepID=UPI003F5757C0